MFSHNARKLFPTLPQSQLILRLESFLRYPLTTAMKARQLLRLQLVDSVTAAYSNLTEKV